jgi:hypothetical protein
MEIENVEQLLNYVFDDNDVAEEPSMKEYKKLTRIMTVMVRFYQRGEAAKKAQYEEVTSELQKIEVDVEMLAKQKAVLGQFPAFHPKRKEYEGQLDTEMDTIQKAKKTYEQQAVQFKELYVWGGKIVQTMNWLEKNLKHYANQELQTNFETEPITVTVEDYLKYRRGLDEVTYNLQESQDFFEASIDGRLQKYHQLEKCMIEAQLQVIQAYPETNLRRLYVEGELMKDLEFVKSNMEDNPKVHRHRLRMQEMHKDFFSLLKWQRLKLLHILEKEPEKIIGDVEFLKAQIAASTNKSFASKFGEQNSKEPEQPPVQVQPSGCPVPHQARTVTTTKPEIIAAKKEQGLIHKVFDS